MSFTSTSPGVASDFNLAGISLWVYEIYPLSRVLRFSIVQNGAILRGKKQLYIVNFCLTLLRLLWTYKFYDTFS